MKPYENPSDFATEQLKKLREIVDATLVEEKLITDNLLNPPKEILSRGQKISDKVAHFGGSWTFIILFFVIFFIWIITNAIVPESVRFDPYPFILMNLILSCVAALQAPVIMMSQNRQEEKDRQRAENDYLINLKSELEIRSLHKKIDLIAEEHLKAIYDLEIKILERLSQSKS